jgi:thioredoxin-like negative regulator of GroEL
MDVSSAHFNVPIAAGVNQNQDQASTQVQKVARNPDASEAAMRAAKVAANDGDRDDAAQQTTLAAALGKGTNVDTSA